MDLVSQPLPLQYEWTFSYDEANKKGFVQQNEYESGLVVLGSFSSVQDFWRYWNHIIVDDSNSLKFPEGANLRMFKTGIVPSWEHPANARGGRWVMTVPKDLSKKIWTDLVLLLVGDQLEHGDDICGAVLSIRSSNDTIALWNRNSEDPARIGFGTAELKERLQLAGKTSAFEYKPHQQTIEIHRTSHPTASPATAAAKAHAHKRSRSSQMRRSRTSNDAGDLEDDCSSGRSSPLQASPRNSSSQSTPSGSPMGIRNAIASPQQQQHKPGHAKHLSVQVVAAQEPRPQHAQQHGRRKSADAQVHAMLTRSPKQQSPAVTPRGAVHDELPGARTAPPRVVTATSTPPLPPKPQPQQQPQQVEQQQPAAEVISPAMSEDSILHSSVVASPSMVMLNANGGDDEDAPTTPLLISSAALPAPPQLAMSALLVEEATDKPAKPQRRDRGATLMLVMSVVLGLLVALYYAADRLRTLAFVRAVL